MNSLCRHNDVHCQKTRADYIKKIILIKNNISVTICYKSKELLVFPNSNNRSDGPGTTFSMIQLLLIN